MGWMTENCLFVCLYWYPFALPSFLAKMTLPLSALQWHLCCTSRNYILGLSLLFHSLVHLPLLMPALHCPNYCHFIITLEIWKLKFSNFVLTLQDYLAILSLLLCYIKFKISLSIFTPKNSIVKSIKVELNIRKKWHLNNIEFLNPWTQNISPFI